MHVGRKPIPGAIDRVAVLHESVEDRQIQIPLHDLHRMDDMVDAGLGVWYASVNQAGGDDLQVVHDHNGGRPCLLHIGSGQGPYVFHGQRESTIDHTQPVPNGPRIFFAASALRVIAKPRARDFEYSSKWDCSREKYSTFPPAIAIWSAIWWANVVFPRLEIAPRQ